MADGVFLLRGGDAEAFPEIVRIKQTIVAEALAAFLFKQNFTFYVAFAGKRAAVRIDDDDGRMKARGTFFEVPDILQRLQQFFAVGFVVSVLARVARRIDARSAAQRVDNESGIVRKRRKSANVANRLGFFICVSVKAVDWWLRRELSYASFSI